MPRNQNACQCRVPISEAAIPVFATSAEAFDWLAARGVTDIGPNHRGETSILVADAQRLYNESAEQAAISEAARARAAQLEEARLAALIEKRQRIYEDTLYGKAAEGFGEARARRAAHEAVELAEANLDLSTRCQLGSFRWDSGKLGAALNQGLQHANALQNAREFERSQDDQKAREVTAL